jgi:hypothetical protein
MAEIFPSMTIQEAATSWPDHSRILLDRWIEFFNLPLEQLRMSHVEKYYAQRVQGVDHLQAMAEIAILRALLRAAGTGEEIHEAFLSPEEKLKLAPEELSALPERARAYIQHLEDRLRTSQFESSRTKDKLRKSNWANWSRSR